MRYALIIYRANGSYPCARGCCPPERSDSLFERKITRDRKEVVEALADSLATSALRETGHEFDAREHHLLIDGFAYDPAVEDFWACDIGPDEDVGEIETLHKEGAAIFAEAQALNVERIESAKLEAERKASEEAERQKKLLREQEVTRLARLTKDRDELAKKLGVS